MSYVLLIVSEPIHLKGEVLKICNIIQVHLQYLFCNTAVVAVNVSRLP